MEERDWTLGWRLGRGLFFLNSVASAATPLKYPGRLVTRISMLNRVDCYENFKMVVILYRIAGIFRG